VTEGEKAEKLEFELDEGQDINKSDEFEDRDEVQNKGVAEVLIKATDALESEFEP
jgi:hypothetical protein